METDYLKKKVVGMNWMIVLSIQVIQCTIYLTFHKVKIWNKWSRYLEALTKKKMLVNVVSMIIMPLLTITCVSLTSRPLLSSLFELLLVYPYFIINYNFLYLVFKLKKVEIQLRYSTADEIIK